MSINLSVKRLITLCTIILLLSISYAISEDSPFQQLLKAKTIRCYLDRGATADWIKGKLDIKISKCSESKEASYLTFDLIDIKNQSARLVANVGAEDVQVMLTPEGMTFVEYTPSGNINITTIFPYTLKSSGEFVFVQSRHIKLLGQPLPQQYYGTCKILEYNE